MLGQAAEIQAGKQRGRRAPLLEEEVLVEVLEQGRGDEVAPPAQDAAPLRPEDRLAAADGDQIGALFEEAAEVSRGRKLGRGVDEHRALFSRRDLRHRGKGRPGARLCDVEDAGGALPASSISQASASRTPAPLKRSAIPTSTRCAPAARTAWS